MDEKTIQRIKKLQALAERGVGGEKTTAQKKLAKLLKDNGINSLDELQKEEYEYTIFSYNGKHEIKLLRQCMYKVMGAKSDRTAYKPYGRRQKIGIYCTKAQKIEIELEFEFYRNVFYEELSTFMDAFIQAQKIFPEDAPVGDYDEFNERDMKIAFMAKLSVYGWRCSCNKGRHGRTAVCSSNTEAVRNAREVGEADSDSKGIYRHAGEFRPPAHYRGQSRGLRRVSGSVQTVCRP
jgi:hypothetical protein